jgi:cell division inhibitor SepF
MAFRDSWHRALVYFGLAEERDPYEEEEPAYEPDEDDGRASRPTTVLRSVRGGNGRSDVRVHLVIPKSFNDAQQVADKFKDSIPVVLNLQGVETELSKRLIDFASGLTYALDGGMQRIADKVFMLTPRNVQISAEERAQLIEKGFFNQS